MKTARIVISQKWGKVTLNGETIGRATRGLNGRWTFTPKSPATGPCGGTFTSSKLYLLRGELYRRLSVPLSGR